MTATERRDDARHGIFRVGGHLIALPVDTIEDIFILPPVHRAPGARLHERGLASVRGKALPALDLRVSFGMPSASSELEALIALLSAREQDHRAWLDELLACLREGREFRLTRDPRACKFGQWYFGFRTEDAVLRMELERFEQPHAAIHALADRALALAAAGDRRAALDVVESARAGLLEQLVALFESTRQILRRQHREIGVTVIQGGERSVFVVDSAEAVADLKLFAAEDDPLLAGSLSRDLIRRLGQWAGAQRPVLIIDQDRIIAGPAPERPGDAPRHAAAGMDDARSRM